MDAKTKQLLMKYDSDTEIECPSNFDYDAEWEAVRAFKVEAEKVLGFSLEPDKSVQDASFFTELFSLEQEAFRPNGVIVMVYKIGIRFSSFGRMATIHSNSATSDLRLFPIEDLIRLLDEHGYQYIDARSIEEPYDGKVPNIATWWIRFFDYL